MKIKKMDSERAREAFEELRPRLDMLTELRRPTVDVEKAAAQAAAIGRMVKEPEVWELFAMLPSRLFDIEYADVLEKAALAAWYAVVEHRDAAVNASRARVPAELVKEADELKQRMLRVVSYCLVGEAEVAIIADIQAGTGHSDRASDLLRLGKLYELHQPVLAQDRIHYRRDDAARAVDLAHRINAHLGDQAESAERAWAEYVHRAWTFLLKVYDEVCMTGRWLFRDEDGDKRFPSLIASWRQSASRGAPSGTKPEAPAQG